MSKLFVDSIKKGDNYNDLKKTVTINIVEFKMFELQRFHTTFHFYEDQEEDFQLTDLMEAHFIECAKFRAAKKDLNDELHRWLLFLDENVPVQQLKELMEMDPIIRRTEERLEWLSGDEDTIRLYEARENSRLERDSIIATATSKGKAEGVLQVAKNMLQEGFTPEQVSKITGISIAEILKWSKESGR
jgi:predicted transposase/invertase (TIGR01784 family)